MNRYDTFGKPGLYKAEDLVAEGKLSEADALIRKLLREFSIVPADVSNILSADARKKLRDWSRAAVRDVVRKASPRSRSNG